MYFDNGTAVATNAHILAIANFKHSKSQQGKILNLFDKKNPNKYIDAKFPQYKEVIPKYENFTDFIDLQTIVNDAKINLKEVKKEGLFWFNDQISQHYNAQYFYDIFKFLLDTGAKKIKYALAFDKALHIIADNKNIGLIMPKSYDGKLRFKAFSYSKKGYNENFKGHGLSGSDLFDKTKKSTTKIKNTIRKTTVKRIVNTRNVSKPISENVNRQSLAYKMANKPVVASYFTVANKQISDFLGNVERKTKESVFISLTGGQGSMKTRMAFQFMNALAQNYKVGHASIEEHPESVLYFDKAKEYLNEKALHNIENPEIKTLQDLHLLVENNDVIVIDSYTKMQEMVKGFEVDKDLRKKYNGKLFLVIFQQTTDGKMRGGSKSQFDADIVLFTKKESDYRDNYVYTDKNRYQKKPLDSLHFNIFSGKLVAENTTEANPEQIETALNQINKLLSFEVN